MESKTRTSSVSGPLGPVFEQIESRAEGDRADLLKSLGLLLLSRAPADFFRDHDDAGLVELVESVFDLLESTRPDEIAVRVTPRSEPAHAATVEVLISDRPFVVDTLRQYLTSREFEIRHILHPVIVVDRAEDGSIRSIREWTAPGPRFALAHCEFEGHVDRELARSMEGEIRTCMEEVRLATDDFPAMLEELNEIASSLRELGWNLPDRAVEIEEAIEFLHWLRDGGFIFLGYRGYDVMDLPDRRRGVAVERGSGLGILRREETSSLWEPKPMDELPAEVQARAIFGPLLIVTKANSEARVHRRARMDYIGIKKLNEAGEVVGEHRFLGLFTWQAYTQSADDIPILRRKLSRILEAENVPEGSHDYKAIVAIFDSMPKEELFLISVEELRRQIATIMSAEDTGEVRLVLTPDILGRGTNVTVILPKRNYSDEIRSRLRNELTARLGGSLLNDYLALGEGDIAHLHFYLSASPDRMEDVDIPELEARIARMVRTWKQRLRGALEERHRAEQAHRLAETYLEAFSPEYEARVDVDTAVEDIDRLELLERGGLMQVAVAPHRAGDLEASVLRLFVRRGSMILADVMPTLEHLGLRVLEADTVDVPISGGGAATIHNFVVQGPDRAPLDIDRARTVVSDTLLAVRAGLTDDDPLNALVVMAGMQWPQVSVLRAYAGYAFQIEAVSSRRAVLDALTEHSGPARLLFDFFRARFDPDLEGDREAAVREARSRFLDSLQEVASISDDQTFRRLFNLIEATVRTNYYQTRARQRTVPSLSLKFECDVIQHLPRPRPAIETYVRGSRTEGSHLRYGPVARGGVRWSLRPDDFRTEVLGLVKTQQIKNAVIVPVGAKGAFVARRLPADRAEQQAAALDSYQDFIRGLLDVTDNIVEGRVTAPPETVVYDDQDPYLVVAADRGTASFSDAANAIAAEYDFWLGDAFASGGSYGYDHKREGITARGVWECARRHFREIGVDIVREPVTVIGIGDMSGDVFGNGMLLSRTLRLLAAFDHRSIFIDPDPDPDRSYEARQRLFETPGSSWADYDRSALSPGGGVYPRGAKEIRLSDRARELLGVTEETVNGQALIRAILGAPADLLWSGGVGTYVKASSETHADVGDSGNDPVRVDARDLQVKVVGEGGNLGLTQLARVEFALNGGRVNMDAIDNSAGVDMSDHEVNLKILLGGMIERGDLTLEGRNELLEGMTDDVSRSVLADNRSQSRALSLEQQRAGERLIEFRDSLHYLERYTGLDRALEFLPSWEALQERVEDGKGLTRPELGVLHAYSKMHLKREIVRSTLPDDPALTRLLRDYFPSRVSEQLSDEELRSHWLCREIIATELTNRIVDLMGTTFIPRAYRDTGSTPAAAARGWFVAAQIANARGCLDLLAENESSFPATQEYQWLLMLEGVLDRTVRWAVENLPEDAAIGGVIEAFQEPVAELCEMLPSIIRGSQRTVFLESLEELRAAGTSESAGQKLAALRFLEELMEITRISREIGASVGEVGRVYFALAEEVDFAWLLDLLEMAPGEDPWEQRVAQGLMQDLGEARRNLTLAVMAMGDGKLATRQRLERFRDLYGEHLRAMRGMLEELLDAEHINLAALTVATREMLRQSQTML